jgi:flagellar basal-body rod protein FlgB
VNIINDKTIDVTTLALDGLMQKHRSIAANIANADVAGYQRSDVSFEDQLNNILEKDYEHEAYKTANSQLSPVDPQTVLRSKEMSAAASAKALEARQAYGAFKPMNIEDNSPAVSANGNNVNVEQEMVELAKNTTKYTVLSETLAKKLASLSEVIKGAQ